MLQFRKEFIIVILASTLTLAPKSALGSVFGTLERLKEVDDALLHAGKSLDDLYNLIERAIGITSSETTPTSSEPTESSQETISSLLTSTATPSSSSEVGTSTKGPTTSFSTHLPTSDSSTSQHSVSDSPTPSGASSTTQSHNTSSNQLPTGTASLLPLASFIREIIRTKKESWIEALASISSSHQLSPRSLFKTSLWNTLNFDIIQQRSSFAKHMMENAVRNLNPILDGTENGDSDFAILRNENSFQRMKELFDDKMIKVSGKESLSPANLNMAEVCNQTASTFGELLPSIKNSLATGLHSQFPLSSKDQFIIILKCLLSTWKIMENADNKNNASEITTITTSDGATTITTSDETTTMATPDRTTTMATPDRTTTIATSGETTTLTTPHGTTTITTSDETTTMATPDRTTTIATSDETTRLSTPSPTVMNTSTTQVTASTTPKTPASWRNETTAVVQAMLQIILQINEGNADHTHAFELEQSANLLDNLVKEGEEFEEAGQLDVSSEDLAQVASVRKVAQASEETIKGKIDEAEKDKQELVVTIVMLSLLFVFVLVSLIIAFIRPWASRFRLPKSNARSRRSASHMGDPDQFENARYQDHGQAMSLGDVHHSRPE